MKRGDPWDDSAIDDELRNVSVPTGLHDRVDPATLFGERAIDRMLAGVPAPHGLVARIRAAFSAAVADAPSAPARAGCSRGRWLRGVARDAIAVALSVGIVAALFVTGLRWIDVPRRGAAASRPRVASSLAPPARGETGRDEQRTAEVPNREPRVAVVAAEPTTSGDVGGTRGDAADEVRPSDRRPAVRAAPLPVAEAAGGPGASQRRGPFTGMQVVADDTGSAGATRRAVPGVRGYDLAFEMAHGEPPFVDPAVSASLAVNHPPLAVATDSFDRVWPLPSGRQRGAALDAIRIEHLLASLSGDPQAEGAVPRLDMWAVRSLRPGRPTYLVEVRVGMPAVPTMDAAPVEATLVLDHAAGPDALPLWVAACRGLAAAATRMGPADRLTVIVAERRPRLVAIRAGADVIARVAGELEGEPPFGVADLDAAVTLADTTSAREGGAPRLVVMAHADDAERSVGRGREALHRWRQAEARGEVSGSAPRFVLVGGVPDGEPGAPPLVPGWTLSDPVLVRRRVAEVLFDGASPAARDARLEVAFDPKSVAAYRLVGHRQSVPESLSAFDAVAQAAVDVHAGETVRAVYEVVPRSAGSLRLAGISATLRFTDPAGVERRQTAAEVPIDGLPGELASARGLEVLLAVGVGELASRSVHAVPRRSSVDGLREAVTGWTRRGDVTVAGARIARLLERLVEARTTGDR